jgi:hypothetical protein
MNNGKQRGIKQIEPKDYCLGFNGVLLPKVSLDGSDNHYWSMMNSTASKND